MPSAPQPAPRRLELPRHPDAGFHARTFIDEHFASHLTPEATHHLKLVTTELVNNAVLHGEGDVELRLSFLEGVVRVEVIDEGQNRTPGIRPYPPDPDRVGGDGLHIVETLARKWGAFEGTTHVWADVPS